MQNAVRAGNEHSLEKHPDLTAFDPLIVQNQQCRCRFIDSGIVF